MPNLSSPSIDIKPITLSNKSLILRFLQEYFYEDEPLNSYIYRTQEENVRYMDRGVCAVSCVDEGLSLMATTPCGKLAAIVLNETVKNYEDIPQKFAEKNPIFPKVRKIVAETEEQIQMIAGLRNPDQKEMCLKVICIHPEWRSKGLGKVLLNYTRDVAKKNGFCQIRSTCTSLYSAKMFAKFGFTCVYEKNYEDYKVDGEIVFKPHKPHNAIRAMVLRL